MGGSASFRNARKINGMISDLIYPNDNSTGSFTKAEHIKAYIEAISQRNRALVQMMDKHAKFAFAEEWVDDQGRQRHVSKEFHELRRAMLHMTPQELSKLRVPLMDDRVTNVTIENGEIKLHLNDGTTTIFDPSVTMWPI